MKRGPTVDLEENEIAETLVKVGACEVPESSAHLTFLEIFSRTKHQNKTAWIPPSEHHRYQCSHPGGSLVHGFTRQDQTLLARFRSGYLKTMKFSEGCKNFELCRNCSSELALPAPILECLGLSKQDLADDLLLVFGFFESVRCQGNGIALLTNGSVQQQQQQHIYINFGRNISLIEFQYHEQKFLAKPGLDPYSPPLGRTQWLWLHCNVFNLFTSGVTENRAPSESQVLPLIFNKLGKYVFSAGGIIGPYFLKNDEGHNVTVNGDRYRAMITNFFIPELDNHDVQELLFQQDGATCHTARATIDLLKDTFGDRLISLFEPVNWPPRSCDLTPVDYFLWGYVKSLVYANKPQTLDHLEDNLRRVIADIRPQMLEKVIENWTSSLDYIRASRGSPMPEIIFKI
ncbi:DUF4817 domain-containing protein [Trichonephila clavipes]|nr:DUF4817 domain-containing protein [Trichonephila clavipes]